MNPQHMSRQQADPAGLTSLRCMFANTGWLVFERVVKLLIGIFAIALTARYLGAERFGTLTFSLAIVALYAQVATLGLNSIVTRDLVEDPKAESAVLGTAFFLRGAGGLLASCAALGTILLLRPADSVSLLLVAVYSLGTIFRTLEVLDFYFQAHVQSRFVAAAKLLGTAVNAGLIISLVAVGSTIVWFAAAKTTELAVFTLALLTIFVFRGNRPTRWRFQLHRAKAMLRQSWPLILSGFGAVIYLKLDQIMLGQMIGDHAVGIYAAAAQLSEAWYFLPIAIASSAFPNLIKLRSRSPETYEGALRAIFGLLGWLGILIAVFATMLASLIVHTVYGSEFLESAPILAVHIWACAFIFMRAALSKWLIMEHLYIFSLLTHSAGAFVNIALNLVLIPSLEGLGAAIATVVSYTFASYLALFLHPRTWPIARLMTVSIIAPVPWSKLLSFLRR